ncbi:hypothetical protein AAUPMG_12811, partial [Pasteurella multocida subsp. multocida str. Anand1_goat]
SQLIQVLNWNLNFKIKDLKARFSALICVIGSLKMDLDLVSTGGL